MSFPQIVSYTQAIQQNGPRVFKTLRAELFEPSNIIPIKIYHYGVGAFAVVFKIKMNNRYYAVRCFLSSKEDISSRYDSISACLKNRSDLNWKVNFEYLKDEINIGGKYYPIVLMDWVDGIPIGKYVAINQTNIGALTTLQQKLIVLSNSLTSNKIGHGDLQSGNILISKGDNEIKLIDYDSMYVPLLNNRKSNELGRPEYQHPRRNRDHYNEKIDWFSIWVMITALEAVKVDPKLWNRKSQGGFNSQENFLFLGDDFINPEQSNLFNILLNKNDKRLKFYLQKLLRFCKEDISAVEKPVLAESLYPPPDPTNISPIKNDNPANVNPTVSRPNGLSVGGKFLIRSNPSANVLTKSLKKISTTPCELDMAEYAGKSIILNYSGKTKTIELKPEKDSYSFDFI